MNGGKRREASMHTECATDNPLRGATPGHDVAFAGLGR